MYAMLQDKAEKERFERSTQMSGATRISLYQTELLLQNIKRGGQDSNLHYSGDSSISLSRFGLWASLSDLPLIYRRKWYGLGSNQ
jgi:hypothetical protein